MTAFTSRWIDDSDPYVHLPKVSLHDHLDGSLRPATIVELATASGSWLPTTDPEALERWFQGDSDLPGVDDWEQLFGLTTSVMQTPENLRRCAREYVLTAAADGVVYAESRWAPEKHLLQGMTLDEAVDAVRDGIDEGMQQVRAAGRDIYVVQILSAMRNTPYSLQIAELALRHRDAGVVALDLAGHEEGWPAKDHSEAFSLVAEAGMHRTVHAGEADGALSVVDALDSGRAERIGHGVRIVEDIAFDGRTYGVREAVAAWDAIDHDLSRVTLGASAQQLKQSGVPLEVCVLSNSDGGVVDSVMQHPVDILDRIGIGVTVNPDNRLITSTSITREFRVLSAQFGWTPDRLGAAAVRAIDAGFAPAELRERIRDTVILPGYAH